MLVRGSLCLQQCADDGQMRVDCRTCPPASDRKAVTLFIRLIVCETSKGGDELVKIKLVIWTNSSDILKVRFRASPPPRLLPYMWKGNRDIVEREAWRQVG